MAKIHQLSATLSNQIAAGEVIERPASVVKELVENSIDAGATQVEVTVEDAGLKSLQVIDNGGGIEPADVPTAFKRHATSKILTTKDLFNVHSLGFRGEALASIAAVADVTLQTATESGAGTVAHIVGGEMQDQHTDAVRQGTQVTVRNLFFNTPARLKYVSSLQNELSHIADIVNRLALAHPEVAFTLKSGATVMMKTTGHGDLQQSIAGIYGVKIAKDMVPLDGHDADFTVTGFVSPPDTTRSSRNYISLMINGRYVKNYALNKALIAGYGSKLMVGRYPIGVLCIDMDPLLVDVNVHPTKQEVRLSKETAIATLVTQTIRDRLAQENLIPDALANLPHRNAVNMEQLTVALNDATQNPLPDARPATQTAASGRKETGGPAAPTAAQGGQVAETNPDLPAKQDLTIDELPTEPIFNDKARLAAWDARYGVDTETPAPEADSEPNLTPRTPPAERFPQLRFLAQVHGTYLLAEAEDGMYLVDQHAAQERVNYEHFRVAFGQVSDAKQPLLVPIVLEYPASDAVAIRAHLPELKSLGLDLEDFGQNSFVVRQHPTWFQAGEEERTIREMIDWVLREGRLTVAEFREQAAIMVSCKSAIKANHHLDAKQAQALLDKLATTENPFNCPHGRPTLVHFSNTDLEKMFKRIQDSHVSFGRE